MMFFLIAYSLLGAGIKYVDDAFDRKTFSKAIAIGIMPLLVAIGVYSMVIDVFSATILLAILGGVLLKFKVDNIAFIFGFIITIVLSIALGVQFLLLPLIMLIGAAILDEVGNDYIDSIREKLDMKNPLHVFAKYFLGHRWIMKTAILSLALINILPLFFFFAMILFDYSYLAIDAYSNIKLEKNHSSKLSKAIAVVGYIFK